MKYSRLTKEQFEEATEEQKKKYIGKLSDSQEEMDIMLEDVLMDYDIKESWNTK